MAKRYFFFQHIHNIFFVISHKYIFQCLFLSFCFIPEKLFPVLDITRLAVKDQTVCSKFVTADILSIIVQNISHPPANQLMSIRCLGNMMSHGYGRGLVETCLLKILHSIICIVAGSANLQVISNSLNRIIIIIGILFKHSQSYSFFSFFIADCCSFPLSQLDDIPKRVCG